MARLAKGGKASVESKPAAIAGCSPARAEAAAVVASLISCIVLTPGR